MIGLDPSCTGRSWPATPGDWAGSIDRLFNWDIGEGPVMTVPAGLGGPEPGPGGHLRQGEHGGVNLYIQVRDLRTSLAMAAELGGEVIAEPFDLPGTPTLAVVHDPEGNQVVLVQQ